jgi:ABC-type sugar transport system ATPase subunit
VLQQVEGPQRIYDRPANRFVAGFVGNPGMNFVPGQVVDDSTGRHVDAQVFDLKVASGAQGSAGVEAGQSVVVGVRPEDVILNADGATDSGRFTATVDVVEPLGSEKLVHLAAGEARLVARVEPRLPVDVGATVSGTIRPGRAHLFDASTGKRLTDASDDVLRAPVSAAG